jgi:hypothetical protein
MNIIYLNKYESITSYCLYSETKIYTFFDKCVLNLIFIINH